jgi:hypothetical protein
VNVARPDICQRIYDIKGWNDTLFIWVRSRHASGDWDDWLLLFRSAGHEKPGISKGRQEVPAYDFDFLLEKVKDPLFTDKGIVPGVHVKYTVNKRWQVGYRGITYEVDENKANATGMLVLDLITRRAVVL